MTKQNGNSVVDEDQAAPLVTEHIRSGLELLWKAAKYAANAGLDRWNFAVNIDEVRGVGLAPTDLRWLIAKGYVQHAREIDAETHDRRSFEDHHRFRFTGDSCFVLSDLGIAFVRIGLLEPLRAVAAGEDSQLQRPLTDPVSPAQVNPTGCNRRPKSPRWDSLRRELWVGCELVKRFRVPAPHQNLVLMVFEEENWPARIDDPLPPQPAIDPKRQLHATISSLNRHQKQTLIQFRGDGNGSGVLWEFTSAGELIGE